MVLILPFQFGFLLFLFLIWWPWPELPILYWIKVVRVDILVLFLPLEDMLSDFYHWVWCSLWVCHFGLYYIEVCSLYTNFLESFCHKWMLNFVKSFFFFFASIRMIILFLPFNLLMWCITLIHLKILNHPWVPGLNPTYSWCMILLMYYWIWFAKILLRFFFTSVFISDIGL